jgi:hypothetical protein
MLYGARDNLKKHKLLYPTTGILPVPQDITTLRGSCEAIVDLHQRLAL